MNLLIVFVESKTELDLGEQSEETKQIPGMVIGVNSFFNIHSPIPANSVKT